VFELPNAVRWARRKIRNELDYTKWHGTKDCNRTLCGIVIPVGILTLFPEEEDIDKVDCFYCKKALDGK
jgi:hypothetical protein